MKPARSFSMSDTAIVSYDTKPGRLKTPAPIIVDINAPPEALTDAVLLRKQENCGGTTTCRFSGSTLRGVEYEIRTMILREKHEGRSVRVAPIAPASRFITVGNLRRDPSTAWRG